MFRDLEQHPNSEVAADLPKRHILLVAMLRSSHRMQNGCLN